MEEKSNRSIPNDWRDRGPRRRGILIRNRPILCCRCYREILLLVAALASVVIATCCDGDTCTTTTGERVRLACIDTPELIGKRAEPVPARAARDHLRNLVVGKKVGIRRITKDRYGRTVVELFLGTTNVQQEMVVSGHANIYWKYAHQCCWTKDQ